MSGNPLAQVTRWCNGAGVVNARRPVEGRDVARPGLVEALGEAVTRSRSTGTLLDHLGDCAGRAWVLYDYSAGAVAPACGTAVVVLH